MKILFDANTPAPLRHRLRGHEVVLATELRWERLENGVLLDAAERHGFDVLVTCDKNIAYQQNFVDRKIAVVILWEVDWGILKPWAARIATRIDFVQRGQVIRIDAAD